MPTEPESWLRLRGLEPLAWDETLRRIEARLSPREAKNFRRLHRAFAAYPTEGTCRAFYDFAARHDLHDLLAGFRFHRVRDIAGTLAELPLRNRRVLDFGAGGGYLAGFLRDELGARVFVADLSPLSLEALARAGFEVLPKEMDSPPARFDVVLCADSLCEIHADEDDWLSDPAHSRSPDFAAELDARYGLSEKLAGLKPLLAPGGSLLLHEPIRLEAFWIGAAALLRQHGWRPGIRGDDTARFLHLQSISPSPFGRGPG